MAKSTYYFEISKKDAVAERNRVLLEEISKIFEVNKCRYGVRRVHQELINRGYQVNHKRVQRLMHKAGLIGKRPKEKYHSYKGEVGKIADNIIDRDFSTTAPLQKWTTDVSQFNFSWGKCYISPVLDMNTNEIISYDLSMSPNFKQIERMLNKEMYYGYEKDYSSFEEFSKAVEEYIDYYNNRRIQAKTKWMPPVQYRIASMCSA